MMALWQNNRQKNEDKRMKCGSDPIPYSFFCLHSLVYFVLKRLLFTISWIRSPRPSSRCLNCAVKLSTLARSPNESSETWETWGHSTLLLEDGSDW